MDRMRTSCLGVLTAFSWINFWIIQEMIQIHGTLHIYRAKVKMTPMPGSGFVILCTPMFFPEIQTIPTAP